MIVFNIVSFFLLLSYSIANGIENQTEICILNKSNGNELNCFQNTQIKQYQIQSDYLFNSTNLNEYEILTISGNYTIKSVNKTIIHTLIIEENVHCKIDSVFQIVDKLHIKSHGEIEIIGDIILGGMLIIDTPQLNKPPIIHWNQNQFHLPRSSSAM